MSQTRTLPPDSTSRNTALDPSPKEIREIGAQDLELVANSKPPFSNRPFSRQGGGARRSGGSGGGGPG